MIVLVHDYGGYAFPVQLSRSLATRGYEVVHVYCSSLPTTPQVKVKEKAYLNNLTFIDISLDEPLAKYSLHKRWRQETEYGKRLAECIERIRPDVVISGNTPLDAQKFVIKCCQKLDIKFVFWVQDLLGIGAYRILKNKIPIVGHAVGWYYYMLERLLLRKSDEIVLITDDFLPLMERWGINLERVHIIPNWAPLEELSVQPKDNEWARSHNLHDKFCFLYSGTLGLKHNPELLVELAFYFRENKYVCVVVISQGVGADYLRRKKSELNLDNLIVMEYQPYKQLPQVLGTADVLIALLEPDAGNFSVPSKVLTYLCAERPLLLAVPPNNLASRIIMENQAGLVVHPTDVDEFLRSANILLNNPALRERLGRNARCYAEKHFDINKIVNKFEKVIR